VLERFELPPLDGRLLELFLELEPERLLPPRDGLEERELRVLVWAIEGPP
jgi:hypothetical protein